MNIKSNILSGAPDLSERLFEEIWKFSKWCVGLFIVPTNNGVDRAIDNSENLQISSNSLSERSGIPVTNSASPSEYVRFIFHGNLSHGCR